MITANAEHKHKPKDWKVFLGDGGQHDGLLSLPEPPPWRFSREPSKLELPADLDLDRDAKRAAPFKATEEMILAVNSALYLRRPLLITGKPGIGKSTLIYKVAHELMFGPVIRWPITSRSTVRSGVYEYDAVGRLQASKSGDPPVEQYLTLGPLGTALLAKTWPRPLLIDEIDKSDLDFANDLLNVIEEGEYDIPELQRLGPDARSVCDYFGQKVDIPGGRLQSEQFPFVVMTSNAEREFPAPFLRRCVRLTVMPPDIPKLTAIVESHLAQHEGKLNWSKIKTLVEKFDGLQKENQEVSTDQLLNAVFLTIAVRGEEEDRKFDEKEIEALEQALMRPLSGPSA
jgi:MoxR-like ATPase